MYCHCQKVGTIIITKRNSPSILAKKNNNDARYSFINRTIHLLLTSSKDCQAMSFLFAILHCLVVVLLFKLTASTPIFYIISNVVKTQLLGELNYFCFHHWYCCWLGMLPLGMFPKYWYGSLYPPACGMGNPPWGCPWPW